MNFIKKQRLIIPKDNKRGSILPYIFWILVGMGIGIFLTFKVIIPFLNGVG